jgi:glycosyltransferase involved in cell wall biosynthesis
MSTKTTAVHVTHEAVGKIGGIGAVLDGLFTSQAYNEAIGRSILVSPLFSTEGDVTTRLGPGGEVLYSSLDGLTRSNYYSSFRRIEEAFNVQIVYGRRTFQDSRSGVKSTPEVILIDITRIEPGPVNELKSKMFHEFGIRSNLYEHLWEYEQYVRLAPPAIAVLKAIGAAERDSSTVIVSHEFMGMPTALAGILDPFDFKTVFYAHEVAPMRHIVESHTGHDTMFYNVIRQAHESGLYLNEVFGDQSFNFKFGLVDAARFCDNILAVGDCVVDELRFMAPEFDLADIDLTYNGIPAFEIGLAEKQQSRQRLRDYCKNILGYRPDYVFTHVTRLVPSKGLWRDMRVLENLDREFQTLGKTAVLFVLSTEIGKRRNRDIYNMEAAYNWPVAHREGLPDLSGGEASYYAGVQEFNAKSRNIKIVYINQFGFDRECCGMRVPYDMEFMDIRKGSDAEFGQSIYEPFGIAQLEPLSFGGICVVTNVCGCAGFVRAVTGGKDVKNVIIADYTNIGDEDKFADIEDLKQLDRVARDRIEKKISEKVALELAARLPKTDDETSSMIRQGYDLARHMSWDAVVEKYVAPSLTKALKKLHHNKLSLSA